MISIFLDYLPITKQAKLLGLIKKSELNIGTLLQEVAAGNVDNKIILEKLESIYEDLISEGKNIILVSGPQGPQGKQGLAGPAGLQGPKGDKGDPNNSLMFSTAKLRNSAS